MDKYKWDLTKIIKNEKEFNSLCDEVNDTINKIITYKDKIMLNSTNLFDLLELDTHLEFLIEKLYVYSHLSYYDNMGSTKFQEYKEKIEYLVTLASSKTSFITPELLKSEYSKVEEYIKENNKLERYRLSLERTYRYKSHILSEQEEKLLSDISEITNVSKSTYDALNNIDVKFDSIKDENGKKIELNHSNYGVLLTSKDRSLRKRAFNSCYKYYEDHINTISNLYIGKIKTNSFISKTRKYKNSLEMKLFPDEVNEKLYDSLIKVTNNNLKYLKDFYKVKSNSLGYKLHMYDLYVNTSKKIKDKIDYEYGIKLLNEALKPLGSNYLSVFNHLLNNHCVDVYPKDKKRSGAYEWAVYGVDPYVSLNYENDINSVSTLAHEMGHAMHTYYSNKNQDYLYASYPIFLAEIASTVNEILLSEYLINNSKTKDEKEYYLIEFLDKFKATVYRQTMFAEFEKKAHEKYEKDNILTSEYLCNEYLKLNKKHFSPVVKVDDTIKYEWARIPHFYDSFYVYKYATGFISALIIADNLLNKKDFKEKYIKFLSSGSIMYPLDLLNNIDIDLTSVKELDRAFQIFNEKLNMLKELEKEV